MKKLIFVLLVVGLLAVLVAPALANEGGEPNDNACWGQSHKGLEDVSGSVHYAKNIMPEDTNFGQYCKDILKPAECS